MELWHNPKCSKSRAAKAILDQHGVAYVERRYLEDPPDVDTLNRVLTFLGKEPWDITRMGEDRAKELRLKEQSRDRAEWLSLLVANPILIERPILITGDGRAVIGRPPEVVESRCDEVQAGGGSHRFMNSPNNGTV
jgi:arsenate reductase (glutaredoxin)